MVQSLHPREEGNSAYSVERVHAVAYSWPRKLPAGHFEQLPRDVEPRSERWFRGQDWQSPVAEEKYEFLMQEFCLQDNATNDCDSLVVPPLLGGMSMYVLSQSLWYDTVGREPASVFGQSMKLSKVTVAGYRCVRE